jgi:hypothetical protein
MLSQVAFLLIFVTTCNSISDTAAFMEEWDKVMRGFFPDDQISFQVEAH